MGIGEFVSAEVTGSPVPALSGLPTGFCGLIYGLAVTGLVLVLVWLGNRPRGR